MKPTIFTPWLYLFIASMMEVCWLLSLKYLDFKAIQKIQWSLFFESLDPIKTLVPLLSYILFGLMNVIFFSMATKSIPLATAFGVWMGTALVGSLLADIFYFKETYNFNQMIFLMMIIIGIVGLKISISH